MQATASLLVPSNVLVDRAGADTLSGKRQAAADLLGAVLRLQSHYDLIRQVSGNYPPPCLLGNLPLKRLGLGLLGPVAPTSGIPSELLADGPLTESERSGDLGL